MIIKVEKKPYIYVGLYNLQSGVLGGSGLFIFSMRETEKEPVTPHGVHTL